MCVMVLTLCWPLALCLILLAEPLPVQRLNNGPVSLLLVTMVIGTPPGDELKQTQKKKKGSWGTEFSPNPVSHVIGLK